MKQYWLTYNQSYGGGDPPPDRNNTVHMFNATDDDDAREKVRQFIGKNSGKTAVALRVPQFRDVPLS